MTGVWERGREGTVEYVIYLFIYLTRDPAKQKTSPNYLTHPQLIPTRPDHPGVTYLRRRQVYCL